MLFGRIGEFYFKGDVKNISLAMFPIDTFKPIPMELPTDNLRKNIRGAFFRMGPEISHEDQFDENRIIKFPVYVNTSYCSEEESSIFESSLSKELSAIPILGIAEKIEGCSGDNCASQRVTSLIAWNDEQSMILELDWCEGNCEYSINPGWFLRSSKKMKLKNAIDVFASKIGQFCSLKDCRTSLYAIPLALGMNFRGIEMDYKNEIWQKEWYYDNPQDALNDMREILALLRKRK
ncbi:MAG: hypothetical protein ACFFBD_05475, partial [Candidatus Hodarchaeota archaeon]